MLARILIAAALSGMLAGCISLSPKAEESRPPAPVTVAKKQVAKAPQQPMQVALVLGGGATRGYAHIGVIKVLESEGIPVHRIVGSSGGAVIGALHAAGHSGAALQRLSREMEKAVLADLAIAGEMRGDGTALGEWVNRKVGRRPIESFAKPFAAVATDLNSGQAVLFASGNAGLAVQASSSIPGVFRPVVVAARAHVDGGLVAPLPVRVARGQGATHVIAVDIAAPPIERAPSTAMQTLLHTLIIVEQSLAGYEAEEADVVIRPQVRNLKRGGDYRHLSIQAGERAAVAALPAIREALGLTGAATQ